MNQKNINVYCKPRIAILANGNELMEIGEKPSNFKQPSSSKPSIISLIQNWMSPEIAGILQKLVGDAIMVSRIAKNRSNV